MGDMLFGRLGPFLQQSLDQIDAPARAVQLVAQQDIGRAGRGAEAAVHAFAQDIVGLGDMRIGHLGQGEGGLHRLSVPALTRPPSCGRG